MHERMHSIVGRWIRERGALVGRGADRGKLNRLLAARPGLPADYVAFLEAYGWLHTDVRAIAGIGSERQPEDDEYYIAHVDIWDDVIRGTADTWLPDVLPFDAEHTVLLSDCGNGDFIILAQSNDTYRVFDLIHELGEANELAEGFVEWIEEAFVRNRWFWTNR